MTATDVRAGQSFTNGTVPHPDYNATAEASLLDALIFSEAARDQVRPLGLVPEAFHVIAHQHIFIAILQLEADGQPVDQVMVAAALANQGRPETFADLTNLTKLADHYDPKNAAGYARTLQSLHRKRQIDALAGELRQANATGEDLRPHLEDLLKLSQPESVQATSWRQVDLTAALAGADIDKPEILSRSDGHALVYAGRVHWIQGESESLKTWLALIAAVQVLDADGTCLWLDFEDDDRGVTSRLLALKVPPDVIRSRFLYVRPDEPLTSKRGVTAAWSDFDQLLKQTYSLCVIDGVTEAMTVEDLDLMNNPDIAAWQRLLPKRIAATTGAAVICIDHVTKNGESNGRYAIGGQHKLAGVTGAAYRVEIRKRLRRADLDPVEAQAVVQVTKDRPGWMRRLVADEEAVATFEMTAWPDGGITASLIPPNLSKAVDLALCRRILEHLSLYDGQSGRKVEEAIGGRASDVRAALKWMAEAGREWLTITRSGNAHQHSVTAAGREAFEL